MRLTVSTFFIAAVAFAGTFVLAPAIADVGQRFSLDRLFVTAPDSAPVELAKAGPDCSTPVAKIVDALGAKECH